ncbi:MAG: hypothetical protein Q7R80_05090, partial [bacterium]|nr:hypothetical protein [bacterium]
MPIWNWSRDDRQVNLNVNWDDNPNPNYSVPVVRRSPLGSSRCRNGRPHGCPLFIHESDFIHPPSMRPVS